MAEPFYGEIKMFAGTYAPRNYAFCDGATLDISQNTALFSLLGCDYGGDCRVTFRLPDLQGRAPMHWGQGPGLSYYQRAQMGGWEAITLQSHQLPRHGHSLAAAEGDATTPTPGNGTSWAATVGRRGGGAKIYGDEANLVEMNTAALQTAGGGHPHDNMQPYTVLNFIIALVGTYPARN